MPIASLITPSYNLTAPHQQHDTHTIQQTRTDPIFTQRHKVKKTQHKPDQGLLHPAEQTAR
ncbi:hypothetical protein IAQ61_004286 [Plenodomus lingam]|uniref:uncharacterized protein n=1 Tax=Leptosphaeria maculans TaxID=5022 RepID=UPI0033283C3A|nr:hypothetical protein IAQ61_004286 [Plenodomus lingam]